MGNVPESEKCTSELVRNPEEPGKYTVLPIAKDLRPSGPYEPQAGV
jgi:hypothetical protein